MSIFELKQKPLPKIPTEIGRSLSDPKITLTEFENKNAILGDSALKKEVCFGRFSDGSYLVSMYCPMPDITAEMIAWWFWWHPQARERYQVWFPGAHFGIGYPKRCAEYFEQKTPPAKELIFNYLIKITADPCRERTKSAVFFTLRLTNPCTDMLLHSRQ